MTTMTRDALLEHRRRQIEDGYEYTLAATSIGLDAPIVARVRRINLTERASINQLPTELQAAVMAGIREVQKATKDAEATDDEHKTLMEAVTENERVLPAANAFCVASFIDPPLVATERELSEHPSAYVVTDLAAEDRIGWFMSCINAESEQAKKLKLFRRKSAPVVSDRATGPVAAAPIAFAEHAG